MSMTGAINVTSSVAAKTALMHPRLNPIPCEQGSFSAHTSREDWNIKGRQWGSGTCEPYGRFKWSAAAFICDGVIANPPNMLQSEKNTCEDVEMYKLSRTYIVHTIVKTKNTILKLVPHIPHILHYPNK